MKKVKLIRVYSGGGYHEYNDEELNRLIPESEILEVTDEEYDLLIDYRIRNQIMTDRYGNYADRLILIEDQNHKLPELIKSAKEILGKIKEKEAIEKKKKLKAEAARKATLATKQIEKAKKILKEAGEL